LTTHFPATLRLLDVYPSPASSKHGHGNVGDARKKLSRDHTVGKLVAARTSGAKLSHILTFQCRRALLAQMLHVKAGDLNTEALSDLSRQQAARWHLTAQRSRCRTLGQCQLVKQQHGTNPHLGNSLLPIHHARARRRCRAQTSYL